MKAKGADFCMGLEFVQSIYEQLFLMKRLFEGCSDCPVMLEVVKLVDLTKSRQVEEIEEEMGYYLV